MAAKLGGVVTLEPQARRQAETWELVTLEIPVPPQGAVHVRVLLFPVGVFAVVRGKHPDLVAECLRVAHRTLPGELVAAGMLGWIQISNGQDAFGGSGQRIRSSRTK